MDAATAPAPVLSPSSKPTGAAALVSPSEPTHAAQADAPAAAVDAPAAAVDVDVAPKKPRRRKGRRPMLSRAAPRSEEDDEARRRALQKRAAEKQARAEAGRKAREAATVAKAKVAQDRIRAAHAKLAAGGARALDSADREDTGAEPAQAPAPRKIINYDELSVAENHRGKANGMDDASLAAGPAAGTETKEEEAERKAFEAQLLGRAEQSKASGRRAEGRREELPRSNLPDATTSAFDTQSPELGARRREELAQPHAAPSPGSRDREARPNSRRGQRQRASPETTAAEPPPSMAARSGAGAGAGAVAGAGAKLDALRSRWGALEFLLREPARTASDLERVRQGSKAGLLFLRELAACAAELGVRAGAILQWVLPFDNNTSLLEQWNVREQEVRKTLLHAHPIAKCVACQSPRAVILNPLVWRLPRSRVHPPDSRLPAHRTQHSEARRPSVWS